MINTIAKIEDPKVIATLNRMHKEARSEGVTIAKGFAKSIFRKLQPADLSNAYLAISKGQGEFVYNLLLERGSRNIVEFGTSFGISTLYLAAAARENGGRVITTELLAHKCNVAQANFTEAGLQDYVDLREGDALETLKGVEDIDFLLLDGWNDLYLPLLRMLEPSLKKGALIYTDNASFASAKPFIQYLRSNPDKYKSVRLRDEKGGSELTEVLI